MVGETWSASLLTALLVVCCVVRYGDTWWLAVYLNELKTRVRSSKASDPTDP